MTFFINVFRLILFYYKTLLAVILLSVWVLFKLFANKLVSILFLILPPLRERDSTTSWGCLGTTPFDWRSCFLPTWCCALVRCARSILLYCFRRAWAKLATWANYFNNVQGWLPPMMFSVDYNTRVSVSRKTCTTRCCTCNGSLWHIYRTRERIDSLCYFGEVVLYVIWSDALILFWAPNDDDNDDDDDYDDIDCAKWHLL